MLRPSLSRQQTLPILPSTTYPFKTKPSEVSISSTFTTRERVVNSRDIGICHASFFDTLFSGSSSSSSSATTNQGSDDLVAELLSIINAKKRGNKPYIGENERIDEIVEDLSRMKVTRNPTRSQLLFAEYDVIYANRRFARSDAENCRVTFSDNLDVLQAFDVSNFGVFKQSFTRSASIKPTGSATFQLNFQRDEKDEETEDEGTKRNVRYSRGFEIFHLDDRSLIVRAEPNDPVESKILQVFVKQSVPIQKPPPQQKVKEDTKSDISVGGRISGRGRKVSGATMAEKKYQQEVSSKTQKTKDKQAEIKAKQKEAERKVKEKEAKIKAKQKEVERKAKEKEAEIKAKQKEAERKAKEKEAEKTARQEERRLQKEKAVAEREAAQKLRAEMKASVDAYESRLREAQDNKKEAATALKTFERENQSLLKDAAVCKARLEGFDSKISGIQEEVSVLMEQEKQYTNELKDYRRQVADLERKLAVL